MGLSENIYTLRVTHKLSQVELAKQLGVTKQSVSNWENNNIMPSIEMLVSIARFFRVSTDYLLGLDERIFLETTGLTEDEIAHLTLIIKDISDKNE